MTLAIPRASPYAAMAPGRLNLRQQGASYDRGEAGTDLQMKNEIRPTMNPQWITLMQYSIFVLPGPGRAWQRAKSS